MRAPLPQDEEGRLAALRRYGVLDTGPEADFDDLTRLAAQICQAPVALVSLVDEGRQWFKSRVGIEVGETPRDYAFCAHSILRPDDLLFVPDATADARFSDNPLVTSAPDIRFYCGAPLVTPDGHALGTLCVIDSVPRELTAAQREALKVLARHVVAQLELRRHVAELRRVESERATLLDSERGARRAAEEANRAKDLFLAMLSHELRTPLTSILGWSEMLLSNTLDEAATRRGLASIGRAAAAQAALIEDLLDVSRIVTGKLRLEVRPLELAVVVEAAAETARTAAEARGVSLEVTLGAAGALVAGDPGRLQQVVGNLLSNAFKFTPAGGRVSLGLESAGADVAVTVEDTGEGIAPEFLPHVFDRFRQADQQATREHGGLGLGLAIVRHLVELHGGAVSAESGGAGRGSRFTVRLPMLAAAGAARPAGGAAADGASAEMPSLAGVKLLVVDDEEHTRELLHTLFEQCGAEVVSAPSAQEALDAVERARPDLIITDIEMAGGDGYELLRRVRLLAPDRGGATPAIALTAHAAPEQHRSAVESGFHLCVSKPFKMRELVSAVARLTSR